MNKKAFHGGSFFKELKEDYSKFKDLRHKVINADVLDAWFEPSKKAQEKIKEYLPELMRTSPPTHAKGLINTIAAARGINNKNILVGGGSSDLMYVLFPRLLKQGNKVLIVDPMYGEYEHIFKNVLSLKVEKYFLKKKNNFVFNAEDFIKIIKQTRPDVAVLVNLNSPIGQGVNKKDLQKIVKNLPKETYLVVDETYIEYLGVGNSMELEVFKNDNLIVLKSMSKVYALSGVRAAYMVLPKKLKEELEKFIPPWPIGNIGQLAAIEALKDEEYYQEKYALTHQLREEMVGELRKNKKIKVYPSQGPFILIELLDKKLAADEIINNLQKKSIYLRQCDSMGEKFNNNFIRIAVKNKEQNKIIIREFNEAI